MHKNGYKKFNTTVTEADDTKTELEKYFDWVDKDAINNRDTRLERIKDMITGVTHWTRLYALELIDRVDIDWNIKRISGWLKSRTK